MSESMMQFRVEDVVFDVTFVSQRYYFIKPLAEFDEANRLLSEFEMTTIALRKEDGYDDSIIIDADKFSDIVAGLMVDHDDGQDIGYDESWFNHALVVLTWHRGES